MFSHFEPIFIETFFWKWLFKFFHVTIFREMETCILAAILKR